MPVLTRSQRAWRWLFVASILPVGLGIYCLGSYLSHRTGSAIWWATGNGVFLATMVIFIQSTAWIKELVHYDDWWKWLLVCGAGMLLLVFELRAFYWPIHF